MKTILVSIAILLCIANEPIYARGNYSSVNTSCFDCLTDESFRVAAGLAAKKSSKNRLQYCTDVHVFNFATNSVQRWKVVYAENTEQPSQPPFYSATKHAPDNKKVAIANDIANQFVDLLVYKVPNVYDSQDPNGRGLPFDQGGTYCNSAFDVTRYSACRNTIGRWLTDNYLLSSRANAFANLIYSALQVSQTSYEVALYFSDGSVSTFKVEMTSTDDSGTRKNRYKITYKNNSSKDKKDNDIPESRNDIKGQGYVILSDQAAAWSGLLSRLTGGTIELNIPVGCVVIIDCSENGANCSSETPVPTPGSNTSEEACSGG